MRTIIKIDSATPSEVYAFTLAFQRTVGADLPAQIGKAPTVTVCGTAMGWESPALTPEHAAALLNEASHLV